MPFARWLLIASLMLLSLTATLYSLFRGESLTPRSQITGLSLYTWLQLLEAAIIIGVMLLKAWARSWGVKWYAVKGIYSMGMIVGATLAGGEHLIALQWLVLSLIWLVCSFFLWWNQDYYS